MKNQLLLLIALLLPISAFADLTTAETATKESILLMQREADTALRGQTGAENTYRLVKARVWLDLALDELYEIDRSYIVDDAMAEAKRLLGGDTTNLFETPIPRGSERIRDDLWQKSAAMKQDPNADCAMRELADLDVHLIWAGHEKWESGWIHAKPVVEVAENLSYEAGQKIARCREVRQPKPGVAPPPVIRLVEKFSIAADAMFPFDKAGVQQMAAGGQSRLAALATTLKSWKTIDRIEIVGHTDRLGKDDYNVKLSLRRAESVRDFLVEQGLVGEKIEVRGLGAAEPIVDCPGNRSAALIACLQPNRRVELTVRGEKQ